MSVSSRVWACHLGVRYVHRLPSYTFVKIVQGMRVLAHGLFAPEDRMNLEALCRDLRWKILPHAGLQAKDKVLCCWLFADSPWEVFPALESASAPFFKCWESKYLQLHVFPSASALRASVSHRSAFWHYLVALAGEKKEEC